MRPELTQALFSSPLLVGIASTNYPEKGAVRGRGERGVARDQARNADRLL